MEGTTLKEAAASAALAVCKRIEDEAKNPDNSAKDLGSLAELVKSAAVLIETVIVRL